jgi:integrase
MSIPTMEEAGNAIQNSEGWFTAYIAVCFIAGLRRGEASALQVGDVDFLRKELRVERQVQWTDDGGMEIRGPKYGSERTVFIPERLVTMIAEHIRLYRPGDDPKRWLFPGTMNPSLPMHSATVGRA